MTDRYKLLKSYQLNSAKALDILRTRGHIYLSESLIWQIRIYELEHYDIPTQVLFHNLSIQEIVDIVQNYIDSSGVPVGNITIDHSVIPDDIDDELIKAEIKFQGEIWSIHKSDKDTFPSQPHAHNYDRQYKLHLGTGDLYRKKIKIGSIRKKDFIDLRQLISSKIKDIKLPTLEN